MKNIVKKLVIYSMVGVLNLGLGASVIEASPWHDDNDQRYEQHDQRWQHHHEKQWRNHEREWKEHDREWREHDGDWEWQERHAHKWHEWYRWHHDNGDDGFDSFICGVITGLILHGEN